MTRYMGCYRWHVATHADRHAPPSEQRPAGLCHACLGLETIGPRPKG